MSAPQIRTETNSPRYQKQSGNLMLMVAGILCLVSSLIVAILFLRTVYFTVQDEVGRSTGLMLSVSFFAAFSVTFALSAICLRLGKSKI